MRRIPLAKPRMSCRGHTACLQGCTGPEHPAAELAAPNNVSMRLKNFSFFQGRFRSGVDSDFVPLPPPLLPPPFFLLVSLILQPSPGFSFLNQHLFLLSLFPSIGHYPPTLGTGVWRRSPRLEISSALLPGSQRRAGEGGGVFPPPSTEEEWGSSHPLSPLPPGLGHLWGSQF